MKPRQSKIKAAVLSSLLFGCAASGFAGEISPFFGSPFDPSASALSRLFRKECIEQRDLDWVRREAVRERKACWWFGTGEQTDCEEEVTGHVRRAVPITRSKLTIVLQMRWSHKKPIPAAGQHIDCSVAVPEQLGVALQRAAIQIRHKYGIRTVPARGDFANEVGLKESSVWPFGLNGLALVLNHYDLGRQLAARIKAAGGQRPDLESQMDGVYGPNATHPWVLWLSHADLKPRIPPELEQMRRALSEPHH